MKKFYVLGFIAVVVFLVANVSEIQGKADATTAFCSQKMNEMFSTAVATSGGTHPLCEQKCEEHVSKEFRGRGHRDDHGPNREMRQDLKRLCIAGCNEALVYSMKSYVDASKWFNTCLQAQ